MVLESSVGDSENTLLLRKKVEENKTWLNKHIYKKLAINNINLISGIIKNIVSGIRHVEENNVEETNNLEIVSNYLKQFSHKSTNMKDTAVSLKEFVYSHFVARKAKTVECSLKEPFLPAKGKDSPFKFTLVLDLDETLVHYVEDDESAYILIRPGAENFLEELSKHYELVVFTAATQDYADFVLNELDKNRRISYRLYRQHTSQNEYSNNIKDLSKIGRDLSKVLIIDNVRDNFQLQKDNGLHIKDFYDDVSDTELGDIQEELIRISQKGVDDIRMLVGPLRERMIQSREICAEEAKRQVV